MSAVIDDDPFGTATAAVLIPKQRKPAAAPQPVPGPYSGPITFTIHGEPGSKANSRKPMMLGKGDGARVQFVKSDKAYAYEQSALKQIPPKARVRLAGPLKVTLRIFYASERPDLDESIVLDVMQDRWKREKLTGERVLIQQGVYRNDRQVREKHVYWGLDKLMPRTEITVEPLSPHQGVLL